MNSSVSEVINSLVEYIKVKILHLYISKLKKVNVIFHAQRFLIQYLLYQETSLQENILLSVIGVFRKKRTSLTK